jgi:hypothetical protein
VAASTILTKRRKNSVLLIFDHVKDSDLEAVLAGADNSAFLWRACSHFAPFPSRAEWRLFQ